MPRSPCLLALVLLCTARTAFAQEVPPGYAPPPPGYAPAPGPAPPPGYAPYPAHGYPPPAYAYPPPPPPQPDRSIRNHDGFYLRMAIGAGYMNGTTTTSRTSGSSLRGAGTPIEISLGGTIASGFVLGGGIAGGPYQGVATPTGKSVDLFMIGPFVDWYFDPKGGLHAQAMLAIGDLDRGEKRSWGGIAGSIGVGHEWWIGQQWSCGILGRVDVYSLSDGNYSGDSTSPPAPKIHIVAPGLLLTFTMH